jgi:Flp pilus assembly protein TadG
MIKLLHRIDARINRRSPYGPETGAALIEFAFVLPLLAILLFGMLDFGKAFNYWIDGTHLSATGARFAVVNKNPGPGGSLQESIRQRADTAEYRNGGTNSVPNALQVCISFPNGSSNVGDPVRVSISTTYNFMGFLTGDSGLVGRTITSTSTMRLEAKPTNYGAGCA